MTLLFPFVDVDRLDDECIEQLRRAIAGFGAFDFTLTETVRFEDGVLDLAVVAVDRIRALITRICEAFPGRTPTTVAPDEVIPHVRVATGAGHPDGPTSDDVDLFDRMEPELQPSLPIACRASAVVVLADSPDGWTTAHMLPLE